MLSFILNFSSPDGELQLQSSRLQPLSSLTTYVATYRTQSESLLSLIQLNRSHEESVHEGSHYCTVLVLPPPTPALEGLDSSYPVSPSSLGADGLDGSGVDSIDGDEFIFGDAFVISYVTTITISWVLGLIAGVQGPGTSLPSALGLRTSTAALILSLFPWVFLMIQGDGVGHLLPRILCSVSI
ncbi:hypothetical protein Peur_058561 [Populus x canadensis]